MKKIHYCIRQYAIFIRTAELISRWYAFTDLHTPYPTALPLNTVIPAPSPTRTRLLIYHAV